LREGCGHIIPCPQHTEAQDNLALGTEYFRNVIAMQLTADSASTVLCLSDAGARMAQVTTQ